MTAAAAETHRGSTAGATPPSARSAKSRMRFCASCSPSSSSKGWVFITLLITALMAIASFSASASGNVPSSRPRRRIATSERSRSAWACSRVSAVALRGAHLVGVDHREMHSRSVVVDQSEHAADPCLELIGRTTRYVRAYPVEPLGQRVGLLAQHRQEQFVLGLEVAVERPASTPRRAAGSRRRGSPRCAARTGSV